MGNAGKFGGEGSKGVCTPPRMEVDQIGLFLSEELLEAEGEGQVPPPPAMEMGPHRKASPGPLPPPRHFPLGTTRRFLDPSRGPVPPPGREPGGRRLHRGACRFPGGRPSRGAPFIIGNDETGGAVGFWSPFFLALVGHDLPGRRQGHPRRG